MTVQRCLAWVAIIIVAVVSACGTDTTGRRVDPVCLTMQSDQQCRTDELPLCPTPIPVSTEDPRGIGLEEEPACYSEGISVHPPPK